MKTSNAFWLFILVFVLVIGLFFFLNKSASQDQDSFTLKEVLSCTQDKLDKSVLALPSNAQVIGAFIAFKKVPLEENLVKNFKDQGVVLDQQSLVFDQMWAEIPVKSLCWLADQDEVSSIFTLAK